MGNPNAPSEKVAAQPKVSLDRVQEFMSFKPAPKTLEKMKEIHNRTLRVQRVEAASRKAEQRTLETMEIALGIRPVIADKPDGLSEEEQKTVEETFDQLKKEGTDETDLEAVRDATMGSLRAQKFYKIHYDQWKSEYEAKCQKDPGYALKKTLHEYLLEQGIQFIKSSGKELVRKSSADFYSKKSGKKKEQISAAELTAFEQKISTYVKVHQEKLTVYYSLDDKDQKKLFSDFEKLLLEAGLKVTPDEAKKFFEELIGHVEYEYLALNDYEATSNEMADAAELNLNEQQWEIMRQGALKKNAKGELKEYMTQQQSPSVTYSGGGVGLDTTPGPEGSYKSLTEVAHTSGVNLKPAEGKGKNVYYLDFPTIKDKRFAPLLKVVYPPGETDINKAKFYIEQPWADKDSQWVQPIDKETTLSYTAAEVPLAVNMMILDYLLNKGIPTKRSPTEMEGPNDILRDSNMIFLAERLLGFRLSEKRMLEEHVVLFKHFLTVLLRDDQKGTLQDRVKKAMVIINNDGLLPYVRKALKAPGSIVKTFDEVVEEAKLEQQGKGKIEK